MTLSGGVDHQHQREHIEKQVSHVGSVTGIANRIALKSQVNTSNVKKLIEDALARNAELEAKNVKVSVKDDTIVLHGDVRTFYEREIIEKAA